MFTNFLIQWIATVSRKQRKVRLRAVPLFQLSPSRERKEIGDIKESAPRENWEREARAVFARRRLFFSPVSFRSRDGLSWERGTARSLKETKSSVEMCKSKAPARPA